MEETNGWNHEWASWPGSSSQYCTRCGVEQFTVHPGNGTENGTSVVITLYPDNRVQHTALTGSCPRTGKGLVMRARCQLCRRPAAYCRGVSFRCRGCGRHWYFNGGYCHDPACGYPLRPQDKWHEQGYLEDMPRVIR